jgi:hypothetical protein
VQAAIASIPNTAAHLNAIAEPSHLARRAGPASMNRPPRPRHSRSLKEPLVRCARELIGTSSSELRDGMETPFSILNRLGIMQRLTNLGGFLWIS